MSYKSITTTHFDKQLKKLSKKYKFLKADFSKFLDLIEENPLQGDSLGRNCYKVRMAISDKNKGKSGGSRVITCVKITQESIYLLAIYDKSERVDLADGELDWLLKQVDL